MTLNIFTDFCNFWWLAWLLPFLLGLLLGRLIWGKWARKYRELEDEHAKANSQINDLKKKIKDCNTERERLSRESKDYQHQLSTARAEINSLKTKQTSSEHLSGIMPVSAAPATSMQSDDSGKKDLYAKVSKDNLQIIEGIGPKMEQVLKDNGIKNLKSLSKSNSDEIRNILNKYGDKYRIIDPSDWVQQASLAADRNWEKLMNFQKADGSESKAEKMFIKMGIIKG